MQSYTENDPLITTKTLVRDLERLGLRAGMTVIVHSSMKQIAGTGFIVGGAQAVIEALMQVITPEGTLVMPSHTASNTDPAGWSRPPVPESWWETIRNEWPAFDPRRSPTYFMGAIGELFRTWPDVIRSGHPIGSCAAWGKHAAYITAGDPLITDLGDDGPIGRIYALDGYVLLLGVGYNKNTSLHLAEQHAQYPDKEADIAGSVLLLDGQRTRVTIHSEAVNTDDFHLAGKAFENALPGAYTIGKIGEAETRFIQQRAMVDFAKTWFESNRPGSLQIADSE